MVVVSCDRCKQGISGSSANGITGTINSQFLSYVLCDTCMLAAQSWVEAGA